MIRINLLPSGKKKAIVLPPSIIASIAVTIVSILLVVGLTWYMNKQIAEKQAEIFQKEQKLKQLEAALEEVKNYERDNKEFREKARVIEQLKKKQTVPLRLLDEVSEMLPKGVWLTHLRDNGGVVTLQGYAFSNSDLVTYVQNLKGSDDLAAVMLVESRQAELGEYSVYKFRLTFNIKV